MSQGKTHLPADFIRKIPPETHCALFYEDAAYARRIELRFILDGIGRGERCFYLVHSEEEESSIKDRMQEDRVLKESLRVNKVTMFRDEPLPETPSDAPFWYEERQTRLTQDAHGPCRVVGNIFPEVTNAQQAETQTVIEATTQRLMACSSMTILCTLPTEKVQKELRDNWVQGMIRNHHAALFAPRKSEGIAFHLT